MATREELKSALLKADAAGDYDAAKLFASKIKEMDSQAAVKSNRSTPSSPGMAVLSPFGGVAQGVTNAISNLTGLVGKGLNALGATNLGPSLQYGAQEAKNNLAEILSSEKQAMPKVFGAGEFVGEMIPAVKTANLIGKGVQLAGRAAPALAPVTEGLGSAINTLGLRSSAVSRGGNLLARVGGGATGGAITGAMTHPDDIGTDVLLGAALPVGISGIKAAPAGVTKLISKFTDKPAEAFTTVFNAARSGSQDAVNNLRKVVPVDDLLTSIKTGMEELQDQASKAYATAKEGWAANTTPLSWDSIDSKLKTTLASLKHGNKTIIGDQQAPINTMINTINLWKNDHPNPTALDLDMLKKALDNIYPENVKHTQAQRVIGQVRNEVFNTIKTQIPEYADAMKAYETQAALIKDIRSSLGGNNRIAKETALNKALSILKETPVGEYKQSLADQLAQQTGVNLKEAVSGQLLSPTLPNGLPGYATTLGGLASAWHNPALLTLLPLASPRLMGEAYHGAGRIAGGVDALRKAVASGRLNALGGP